MRAGRWGTATEVEDEDTSSEQQTPTLVSLHFILTALQRRLVPCVVVAVLGLLAAGAFVVVVPPAHRATASLFLASQPDIDPSRAMATNVSLLQTRTVAEQAIERLDLSMAPEDLLGSLTVEAEGSDLMTLTLSAPTDAEAVRRLEGLTATYLKFRGDQLTLQSNNYVRGLEENIKQIQADVGKLTRQIERLTVDDPTGREINDAVSQRTYLNSRVEALQEQVEDATVRNSAIVSSSRVLDLPAAEPGLANRTIALVLASGLIGGIALGCGTVVVAAITSDKLRRRADVAVALGAAVPVSVGGISPVNPAWRWIPPVAAVDQRRSADRRRLAQAIVDEVLIHPSRRVAVVGLDNTDELGAAVAAAALQLAADDYTTTVLDLTERGSRTLTNALWATGSAGGPNVLRPRGLPALARRAHDLIPMGSWDHGAAEPSPALGDVTLVLADIDPGVGADHLTEWADHVVLIITAGRSRVERVRTVGELVRAAGLDLRFAALLRSERTDDSSGLLAVETSDAPRLRDSAGPAEEAEPAEPTPSAPSAASSGRR